MRKPRARSRILKNLPHRPGGNCAQEGARPRHDRNLVRRRGPHRPEEQDHPPLGQARHPSKRTAGPTDRFHLHLRCSLPEGGQGCSPDHAGLQHRGDELAPRRDRRNRRARCPRHPPGRSSRRRRTSASRAPISASMSASMGTLTTHSLPASARGVYSLTRRSGGPLSAADLSVRSLPYSGPLLINRRRSKPVSISRLGFFSPCSAFAIMNLASNSRIEATCRLSVGSMLVASTFSHAASNTEPKTRVVSASKALFASREPISINFARGSISVCTPSQWLHTKVSKSVPSIMG